MEWHVGVAAQVLCKGSSEAQTADMFDLSANAEAREFKLSVGNVCRMFMPVLFLIRDPVPMQPVLQAGDGAVLDRVAECRQELAGQCAHNRVFS